MVKHRRRIAHARRVVIKLGTGVLTNQAKQLDTHRMRRLINEISNLKKGKRQVILVSSGAIGSGMGLLDIKRRPVDLAEQQACAAIGQSHLMHLYNTCFMKREILTAQILLTQDDLHVRRRYLNARNTLMRLLNMGVVPIINENDTVSVDELRFGDNDILSAQVCSLVEADLLIVLSHVDGLIHPGEKNIVQTVERITSSLEKEFVRDGTVSTLGIGGMRTKLKAAQMVNRTGVDVILANGKRSGILAQILGEKPVGTHFLPQSSRMSARKRWLAHSMRVRGKIRIDSGAVAALKTHGRSLLASGISKVSGQFGVGDLVSICNSKGKEFARGLINMSKHELDQIKGLRSQEIQTKLGAGYGSEVIHRNNLVLI